MGKASMASEMAVVPTPTAKLARLTCFSSRGSVPWMSMDESQPKSMKLRIFEPMASWVSMRGTWVMGLLTQHAASDMGMLPLRKKQTMEASIICMGMGSMEQKRPMERPMEMVFIQGRHILRSRNLMTSLLSQLTLRMRGCLSERYALRTSLE